MARCSCAVLLLCVIFILRESKHAECSEYTTAAAAPEFSRHALVKPRIFHGREKREISSTTEETVDGSHIHDLTVGFHVNGKDVLLDLQLNRELIPNTYFEKYQHRGRNVVNKPTGKDVQLCHYKGKLRGVPTSWAAISTCQGLSGVIFDGEELHYLQRTSDKDHSVTSPHFLYSHSDLKVNHTCGYDDTPHHVLDSIENNQILRYKRDAEVIRGPYNANAMSRYVELVLVVDNKEYKELGENLSNVYHHCKEIANIINALYVPLNIFIALVGVVVWSEFDDISLVSNGDTTLTNFLHYRRERLVKEHPNDNAQLLTRTQFDGGVVGKALKGPICTYEFSGGVSMDHSNVVGLVATTVAHEMGHNFGMEHDTSDCKCPTDRCIMAPSSSSMSPTQWSSCSLDYLAHAFDHGMDYCLRNKPERLFDSPVCGNGFVEAGEQCDCGLKDRCDNPCCNATSCMLYANASCATGECCDFETCHPKNAGTVCRDAVHECDLPEFCTGQSEYCPDNVFKMDGESCGKGSAYCYHGSCRTHSDQCRLLWGPSGDSSGLQCYDMNTRGSRHGNCGYNRLNQSYIQCPKEHVFCGMLHCKHLNERLEFGMESVAILSHSFINTGGNIMPCRTAIVDLGLNEIDPGLAPDGAKCGDGKMCINQKCMSVRAFRQNKECQNDCNGNGVCNSKGHCHCKVGFAPPLCDYPGVGGSEDSGPASDANARKDFLTALYVIFLGIVPLIALIAMFVYYSRRNAKHWWKKRHPAGGNSAQSMFSDKKAPPRNNQRNSVALRGNSPTVHSMEISNPLSTGMESDHASLLSGDANGVPPGFKNNFFGQFKGFSITPLPSSPAKTASTPTRTASIVTPPTVPVLSTNMPYKKSNIVPASKESSEISSKSPFPPVTDSLPLSSRPVISSPVLDATTCTAKEVLTSVSGAPSVPTRPAPSIPSQSKMQKPIRPLSSPNSLTVSAIVDEKKERDNGQNYPTLTRLASLMLRQNSQNQNNDKTKEKEKDKSKNKVINDGTHSLPRKASKLQVDRDVLRNLTISNPIPQQNIEIPSSAIPVKTEDDSERQMVIRAQSLRDNGPITKRPPIQTFGSMRQSTKRPTSIPAAARPTSPPPRPPAASGKPEALVTGIVGMPGYQTPHSNNPSNYCYDDCLNLLTEGTAPLANIDEESSPTGGDNIYAVIEESPSEIQRRIPDKNDTPSKNKKNGSDFKYASPTFNEYKSPKPVEGSTSSGSVESVGLLSEIVNEIQARNLESIYSTSSLGRKNKSTVDDTESVATATDSSVAGSASSALFPDKSSTIASSNSSLGTYVNAPYPSSNIYGGSSVYSNFSTLNNPASSLVPTANSSASSASGYLSPTPVTSTTKCPSSLPSSNSTVNSKPFSTFKNLLPAQTTTTTKPSSIFKPSGLSSEKSEKSFGSNISTEGTTSSYKPYSSSLQRSAGPFASTFKGSMSSTPVTSSLSAVKEASKVNDSVVPIHSTATTKPLSSVKTVQANSKVVPGSTIPGKQEVADPSNKITSNQSKITPISSTRPSVSIPKSSFVAKATPSVPSTTVSTAVTGNVAGSVSNVQQKQKTVTPQVSSNSPDIISSCSVNNSTKAPDVVNSKISAKSPDVVIGGALKAQSSLPSVGKSSVNNTVSRNNSSKPVPNIASKPSTINSSFRNTSSAKQPQTAPKPLKTNVTNNNVSNIISDKNKPTPGTIGSREVPNRGSGRGTNITKSASDASGTKAMPAGARTAASKLSHVASLQQKFETVANVGEKGGKSVPTGVGRGKPLGSTATKSSSFKK